MCWQHQSHVFAWSGLKVKAYTVKIIFGKFKSLTKIEKYLKLANM